MDYSGGLESLSKAAPELCDTIQSNGNFLEAVAAAALNSQHTDLLFAHFEAQFPDICARWSSSSFQWSIVAAFGRVLPFAPYLAEHAETFFKRAGLDSQKSLYSTSASAVEVQNCLLGVFRLLLFDNAVFGRYIRASVLQEFLAHPLRHIRYLAIRALCLYVHVADAAMETIISKRFGEEPIVGDYEGKRINYRLFGLWEERRHADIWKNLKDLKAAHPSEERRISLVKPIAHRDLSQFTVEVLGLFLPKSGQNIKGYGGFSNFILTETTAKNLRNTAECLLRASPILLSGLSGSGKTCVLKHLANKLNKSRSMITLHLNEQSDAKSLIGIYTSGSTPGSFTWKPGVLTTAVREGRWIFIEDIDRAPNEIISTLLPLIERRELLIPSRGETLKAARDFRIIGTIRTTLNIKGEESRVGLSTIGSRFWQHVQITLAPLSELQEIALSLFPSLMSYLPRLIAVYGRLQQIIGRPSFVSENKTGTLKPLSPRDLYKWCRRVTRIVEERDTYTDDQLDNIFLEAVDCFAGSFQAGNARDFVIYGIAEELHIDMQRRDFLLKQSPPSKAVSKGLLQIGRAQIERRITSGHLASFNKIPFSNNGHTARLLERVAVAIQQREPVLLVGETGVGKTTGIQHLALQTGRKLQTFNLSQQSETGDLLGGYKPVTVQSIVVPMKDSFDDLFGSMFSLKKNQRYLEILSKSIAKGQWSRVCVLWNEALRMVEAHMKQPLLSTTSEPPQKKQKADSTFGNDEGTSKHSIALWQQFAANLKMLEQQIAAGSNAFTFSFVEGNLVKAVRSGDWILLDEINLATSDTLDALTDLLSGMGETPFVTLSEAEESQRVEAHPDFRVFAAMNPATDVGKKDLPPGIRSRFTELFVESPDTDANSLQAIANVYLESYTSADALLGVKITSLYQKIQQLNHENRLVNGINQKPHYSLRSLTRSLVFARDTAPFCGIHRALYEGLHMSFCTVLDQGSNRLISPLIEGIFPKNANIKAELKKPLKRPQDDRTYIQESSYWLRRGNYDIEPQQHYIVTPFVRQNLDNLIRATLTRRFPVLLQGPTSSGKTSMIEYLAKKSGNRFIRINNHEHTDLQEYLGTYVSDVNGRLRFQEGVLVRALREGHWIVLDELNLAPTDVLEALNRLLDDNRELFIPETQEVVRPHEDFMLFATQNPAGLYGGRKVLSRAFRNRFLELHFDDIPVDELNEILQKRTQIPPSWSAHIVNIYKELSLLRQENRLFESKSFATLRDLFRWALRGPTTTEELASQGFMLLAERVRKPEEREAVKQVIEKVINKRGPKIVINEDQLYGVANSPEMKQYTEHFNDQSSFVIWTKAMRRLFVLVAHAIRNNEPVLLIGETGCGKTTVCQMLADTFGKRLYTVNAHQNTETGDLIGAQRPVRNRAGLENQLRRDLSVALPSLAFQGSIENTSLGGILANYDDLLSQHQTQTIPEALRMRIHANRRKAKALFEWVDGSLVEAMRTGQFFLLDEISLTDDAVLERLNSVLEPQRTLLLAEKGPEDSSVVGSDGFQFMATMNPGGDYGKRELSAALRNRFTEIWVPSLSDVEDVLQIVHAKLVSPAKPHAQALVTFAEWFGSRYNSSVTSSISLRDMLAWVDFINLVGASNPIFGIVHGAAMVYIDTLGANPSGLLTVSSGGPESERRSCLDELSSLLGADLSSFYQNDMDIVLDDSKLSIGQFSVPLAGQPGTETGFLLSAPTTKSNAMRVIRAMQSYKPILIEGNPGVGKTTLVTALAGFVGKPLTRINLSEQTDLMDLFGSDVPDEGAAVGSFAWRDAPFLKAMKNGDWVLLDEMNLASQSVLEGLNACLDHRGEAYIAELDQKFTRHPNFRLFAAQNPHHQGGGRKGLPASFVNRFTVVYADTLRLEDLTIICKQAFPGVADGDLRKVSGFVNELDTQIVQQRRFGTQGGPWEFNLRDTLRWLDLILSKERLLGAGTSFEFLDTLFTLRFRNVLDRAAVHKIYTSWFPGTHFDRNYYHNLSPEVYQVGMGFIFREFSIDRSLSDIRADLPLPHLPIMESLMICVQKNWPVILSGSSGSGKTSILKRLASATGTDLLVFSMNADVDSMDLVGTYEQADPLRSLHNISSSVGSFVRTSLAQQLYDPEVGLDEIARFVRMVEVLNEISTSGWTRNRISQLKNMTEHMQASSFAVPMIKLLDQLDHMVGTPPLVDKARFEWIDGILVQALEQGKWLVLDHANLCSSSVLDRLNSLLEPNGALLINEHPDGSGEPKTVTPHPNFRIFFTVDPRYGELSRAMRNRAVELYLVLPQVNGEVPQPCLFPFESAIYRLRNCLRIGGKMQGDEYKNGMLQSVAVDHLSLSDDHALQLPARKHDSEPLFQLPEFLSKHSPIPHASYCDSISAFYVQITGSMNMVAPFSNAQSVMPTNNEAFIQQSETSVHSAISLASIYDLLRDLFNMGTAFRSAISVNPSRTDLSRLQRSLVASQMPGALNDSTNGVHKILSGILKNAEESLVRCLKESASCMREEDIVWMKAIFRHWWNIFNMVCSEGFDEATFQVILKIGKLNTTVTTGSKFSEHLHAFTQQSIKGLEESARLSSGRVMGQLWQSFRPAHRVGSYAALHVLLKLENLADEFDKASAMSIRTSLSDITESRDSFAKAFTLILSNPAANLDFDGPASMDLADVSRGFFAESTTPFLADEFEALCQIHDLHGREPQTKPALFAQRATKYARQSLKLSTMAALNGYLGYQRLQSRNAFALKGEMPISLIEKLTRHISEVPLRDVDLLNNEMDAIGQILSHDNDIISRNQLDILDEHLRSLMRTVMRALGVPEDIDVHTITRSLRRGGDRLFDDAPWRDILFNQFQDVFHYFSSETRSNPLSAASNAWVQFGIGCLLLYVPDKAYDPALQPMVEKQLWQEHMTDLSRRLDALRAFEQGFTGISTNMRVRLVERELAAQGNEPSVPTVARPPQSQLAVLQVEFKNVLTLVNGMLSRGVGAALEPYTEQSLLQLIQRLSKGYRAYDDLTGPVVGFLQCIQIGALLGEKRNELSAGTSQELCHLLSMTPFLAGTPDRFCDISSAIETKGPALLWQIIDILALRRTVERSLPANLHFVVSSCFDRIFWAWKARLESDQEKAAAKSSLYKYRGGNDEDDAFDGEELNELFPTYEGIDEQEQLKIASYDPQKTSRDIADAHGALFLNPPDQTPYMQALLTKTPERMLQLATETKGLAMTVVFPLVYILLAQQRDVLQANITTAKYNFYTSPNLVEAKRLVALVTRAQSRFHEIHNSWPEQATPTEILQLCKEALEFRHMESIAKFLTKAEKLHATINEWQVIASKEWSAEIIFADLTSLVISWRQLELATWAGLLEAEDAKAVDDAKAWWFIAYENLIAGPTSLVQSNDVKIDMQGYVRSLLKTLEIFLVNATLGQFPTRIRLLEQFQAHLVFLKMTEPKFERMCDALDNFVSYFSRFLEPIEHAIVDQRKPLERHIQDVIKLASWKDRNINALRESSKASHRKLFKVIKKYRAVLNEPVNRIVHAGLPDSSSATTDLMITSKAERAVVEPPLTNSALPPALSSILPGLPARFRNVSSTTSMMYGKFNMENSPDAASHLDSFITDTQQSISQLRKATPTKLSNENKDTVKHLKNRKRKLFADVLKAIRQMGFKSGLGTDVLMGQDSTYKVLAGASPLSPESGLKICPSQIWFFKFVELMPKVRDAAREHSDEITSAETLRSTGYLESMLCATMRKRQTVRELSQDYTALNRICDQAATLWKTDSCAVRQDRPAHAGEYGIHQAMKWLPAMIEVGLGIISAQAEVGRLDFSRARNDLANWKSVFLEISTNLSNAPPTPQHLKSIYIADSENISHERLQEFKEYLTNLSRNQPQLAYLSDHIKPWTLLTGALLHSNENGNDDAIPSPNIGDATDLCDQTLAAIQDSEKTLRSMSNTTEDSRWLINAEDCLERCISKTNAAFLISTWGQYLDNLHLLESESLLQHAALMNLLLPILQAYRQIYQMLFDRFVALHCAICRMSYVLARSFVQIATQGFCTPAEKSNGKTEQMEKIEEGVGLGEGDAAEGAEDVSKDLNGDEDLEELAQQPNNGEKDEELGDEKDAVEIADEMEGLAEQAESGGDEGEDGGNAEEGSQEDVDSEVGSVDNTKASAVDEKLWDDAAEKDAKDRKAEEGDKGSAEKDNQVASKEHQQEDLHQDESMDDVTGENAEASDRQQPEEAELGHPRQDEKLELPEDLQLGQNGHDEELSSDSEAGTDFGAQDNEDCHIDEEAIHPAQELEHDRDIPSDSEVGSEIREDDKFNGDAENPSDSQEAENFGADDEASAQGSVDKQEQIVHDQELSGVDADVTGGEGGGEEDDDNDSQLNEGDTRGLEGNKDSNAPREQKTVPSSSGELDQKQKQDPMRKTSDWEDESQDNQIFKKLGNALEQWYRNQQAIHNADEELNGDPKPIDQDTEMADAEFQHLKENEQDADTQALGTATEEEATAVDTRKAIDSLDVNDPSERLLNAQEESESDPGTEMDVDLPGITQPEDHRSPSYTQNASRAKQEDILSEEVSEDTQMGDVQEDEDQHGLAMSSSDFPQPLPDLSTIEHARSLWSHHENATRTLSLTLTEHLRLILTPTRATKMRGDFRTGKRLNMKRIIPYIASQYKRDKIWMRRSVPSKRAYQIMLAIDDSSSMAESGGGQLALATVALISRALSMLEAGELGVVAFGEHVQVAHTFEAPFVGDAGAEVFRHFAFKQRKTNVQLLLQESLTLFREARLRATGSSSELWQLQFIISDGVCDDHPGIRRLVRQAQEERIMLVFVIVDAVTYGKKQSIMELQEAEFGPDENGDMRVKMRRYLDTFPFEHYLIVRNVGELPGILAGALRQWFAEVIDTEP